MNITLVGGGAITHTLITLLSNSDNKINLLTRKPESWSMNVESEYHDEEGNIKEKWTGNLETASAAPVDVIPEADIIILSLPVHQYYEVLKVIIPYINKEKKVFLGSIYGQGGFNWMVESLINQKYSALNYFTFGLVPWVCRVKEYGVTGITYGSKKINTIAMRYNEDFEELRNRFLILLKEDSTGTVFKLVDNFLSLTLSVDNQLIHITRLYGLMNTTNGEWSKLKEVPLFYKDYDQFSADCLIELDQEFEVIRKSIKEKYPCQNFRYMMDYLTQERFTYGQDTPSVLDSFVNSKTLARIGTPVMYDGKYKIDINHRFFNDDIFNGIVIFKWFAQKLDLNTPFLDDILHWAGNVLDVNIVANGKLIDSTYLKTPSYYGYVHLHEVLD